MHSSDDDRATLDANYNLRAAVPEFQTYFDWYDAHSAAFRARCPGRVDLAYGAGPRQAIDLFLPAAADPPLVVFIHGGYWQSQDRKRFSFVAGPLVDAGAAVAVIGYDLAPEVEMDAIVAQIRAGLAWLYRHAPAHALDRDRLLVCGHSAGGHLAAMALSTDWAAEAGLPRDLIKGVCTLSGVFDLEPIRLCYLNDVLGMSAGQAERNSPIHLAPQTRCPVLLSVGDRETEAFLEQSRRYAEHLRAAGVPCDLVVQPDLDHFRIIAAMAEAENAVVRWLCRQAGLAASG